MLSLMIRTTKELHVGDIFQVESHTPNFYCHNILLARRKTGMVVLRVDADGTSYRQFLKDAHYINFVWQVKKFRVVSFQNI